MRTLVFLVALAGTAFAAARLIRVLTAEGLRARVSRRWQHPEHHLLSEAGKLEVRVGRAAVVVAFAVAAVLTFPGWAPPDQEELNDDLARVADDLERADALDARDVLQQAADDGGWSFYATLDDLSPDDDRYSETFQVVSGDFDAVSCVRVVATDVTDAVDFVEYQPGFC